MVLVSWCAARKVKPVRLAPLESNPKTSYPPGQKGARGVVQTSFASPWVLMFPVSRNRIPKSTKPRSGASLGRHSGKLPDGGRLGNKTT